MKHKKYLSNGLPKGYNTTPELYNPETPRLPPPAYIHYCEKYVSESSSAIYQIIIQTYQII